MLGLFWFWNNPELEHCLAIAGTPGIGVNCPLQGLDVLSVPEIVIESTDTGGKLIFSDSPESPTEVGKLAYAELPSPSENSAHRVYVYHVNQTGSDKKLAVVLENTEPVPINERVRFTPHASPGLPHLKMAAGGFGVYDKRRVSKRSHR